MINRTQFHKILNIRVIITMTLTTTTATTAFLSSSKESTNNACRTSSELEANNTRIS